MFPWSVLSDDTCTVGDVAETFAPVKSNDNSSAEVDVYHLKLTARLYPYHLTRSEEIYPGLVSSNIEIVVEKSAFFEPQLC